MRIFYLLEMFARTTPSKQGWKAGKSRVAPLRNSGTTDINFGALSPSLSTHSAFCKGCANKSRAVEVRKAAEIQKPKQPQRSFSLQENGGTDHSQLREILNVPRFPTSLPYLLGAKPEPLPTDPLSFSFLPISRGSIYFGLGKWR